MAEAATDFHEFTRMKIFEKAPWGLIRGSVKIRGRFSVRTYGSLKSTVTKVSASTARPLIKYGW